MRLDEHLAIVEEFGFNRAVFDFPWNGHRIHLLKNDAHPTSEGKLQVHLTLYCEYCEMESVIRGKSKYATEWTPRHMQDVKLAALAPYFQEDCI